MTKEQKQWRKKLSNFWSRLSTKNKKTNTNHTTPPDKEKLYKKATKSLGYGCRYCKDTLGIDNISIDHAVASVRGGTNDLDNLDFICKRCNTRKGNLNKDEFIKLHHFLNQPGHEEMKKIILTRIAMGGFLFGRKK